MSFSERRASWLVKPTNAFSTCLRRCSSAPLRTSLHSMVMMTATSSSVISATPHLHLLRRPTLILLLFSTTTTENPTRFRTLHEAVRPCGFHLALGVAG